MIFKISGDPIGVSFRFGAQPKNGDGFRSVKYLPDVLIPGNDPAGFHAIIP